MEYWNYSTWNPVNKPESSSSTIVEIIMLHLWELNTEPQYYTNKAQ